MASNIGESIGGCVGYRVRGESASSRRTRVLVVTEGVLVRRLQRDPTLEGVSCIIFDEFHERSVPARAIGSRSSVPDGALLCTVLTSPCGRVLTAGRCRPLPCALPRGAARNNRPVSGGGPGSAPGRCTLCERQPGASGGMCEVALPLECHTTPPGPLLGPSSKTAGIQAGVALRSLRFAHGFSASACIPWCKGWASRSR